MPPWTYVFHTGLPSRSRLDQAQATVSYDAGTDTLFSYVRQPKGAAISCWVNTYEYLRIELGSRQPIGTQVEDFTQAAVEKTTRLLELAAVCSELLEPSQSANHMLSPTLKFAVVHRAVGLAVRAYDRHHGVRPSSSRYNYWIESDLRDSDGIEYLQVVESPLDLPSPMERDVVAELTHALSVIADQPPWDRPRDFDRLFGYWYRQPPGPTKRATASVLLEFVRQDLAIQLSKRHMFSRQAELLVKAIKAN